MPPRIAEEDYTNEDLIEPGDWIRSPLFGGVGHMVINYDLDTVCGRSFRVPYQHYEALRAWVRRYTASEKFTTNSKGEEVRKETRTDLGDWYLAYDRRKSGHCGPCKTGAEERLKQYEEEPTEATCTCTPSLVGLDLREQRKEMAKMREFEIWRATLGGTFVCEVHDGS